MALPADIQMIVAALRKSRVIQRHAVPDPCFFNSNPAMD
jgi:hypothetical protein